MHTDWIIVRMGQGSQHIVRYIAFFSNLQGTIPQRPGARELRTQDMQLW